MGRTENGLRRYPESGIGSRLRITMRKLVSGKEIQFMDIIKWICMLAIGVFLLPACGKTDVENPKSVPATTESDFEYQFVAESENGYYFWECIN